jgi:hypothetical protein
MKWEVDDFTVHGVFVDDFVTIPTSQKLKDEFEGESKRSARQTSMSLGAVS